MDKRLIIEVAKYIIKYNATIIDTARHFNKSTSSIKKYINDKDKLQKIDIDLYNQVKKTQKIIEQNGQKIGGTISKRKPSITEFETLEIAQTRIENKDTIKTLSQKFNVPESTIYEALQRIKNDELNKQLKEVSEMNQTYNKTRISIEEEPKHL